MGDKDLFAIGLRGCGVTAVRRFTPALASCSAAWG